MVTLPGGQFTMGNNRGDQDERPAHTVTVSPFKIDAYEVTYAQYDTCVKRGSCTEAHYDDSKCFMWTSEGIRKVVIPQKYRSPDYPVVCVTWHQARQYCRYKGKKLPTEAQWEYAARAGKKGKYAWGDQSPSASVCLPATYNRPAKVGSYQANTWQLYDMTGNVWEWTYDRYSRDYYEITSTKDPSGPKVGRLRTIRGGGWYSSAQQMEISNRHWFNPGSGEVSIGIRCVK